MSEFPYKNMSDNTVGLMFNLKRGIALGIVLRGSRWQNYHLFTCDYTPMLTVFRLT